MSDQTKPNGESHELDPKELENVTGGTSAGIRSTTKLGIKTPEPQTAATGGTMAIDDWESNG